MRSCFLYEKSNGNETGSGIICMLMQLLRLYRYGNFHKHTSERTRMKTDHLPQWQRMWNINVQVLAGLTEHLQIFNLKHKRKERGGQRSQSRGKNILFCLTEEWKEPSEEFRPPHLGLPGGKEEKKVISSSSSQLPVHRAFTHGPSSF